MASIDSFSSSLSDKGKFSDSNGEYTLYNHTYSTPCRCHPETCCCGGVRWMYEAYKQYKGGSQVYISERDYRAIINDFEDIPEDVKTEYKVLISGLRDGSANRDIVAIEKEVSEITEKYPSIIHLNMK